MAAHIDTENEVSQLVAAMALMDKRVTESENKVRELGSHTEDDDELLDHADIYLSNIINDENFAKKIDHIFDLAHGQVRFVASQDKIELSYVTGSPLHEETPDIILTENTLSLPKYKLSINVDKTLVSYEYEPQTLATNNYGINNLWTFLAASDSVQIIDYANWSSGAISAKGDNSITVGASGRIFLNKNRITYNSGTGMIVDMLIIHKNYVLDTIMMRKNYVLDTCYATHIRMNDIFIRREGSSLRHIN